MKEESYKTDNYDLHIIKTNKFKKNYIEINFTSEIVEKDVTKNVFLSRILMNSTKNYPTKRLMVLEYENLYNAEIEAITERQGRYINTSFSLICLEEKYTEKNMFSKSLDFLLEVIFNPNVTNDAFDTKSFELVKRNMKNTILAKKENPRGYAMSRFYKTFGKNSPLSLDLRGNLEDLEKITESNIYDFYKDLIKKSKISIYVVGNVDSKKIEEMIRCRFKNLENNKLKYQPFNWKQKPQKVSEIKETLPISQAQLFVGSKLINLTPFERNYVMHIFTSILGGGASSKLFTKIREENSLAYTAQCFKSFLDDVLVCYTAIDPKDYKQALDLIDECFKEMKEGNFEEVEIKKAQKAYLSSLNTFESTPWFITAYYNSLYFRNADPIEKRKQEIMKVTKDDIIAVAKKIYLDTIYLLKGDE